MSRILITEDDKFVANLCSQIFREGGFHVTLAHDGREAIESLKQSVPDVVLLDLMLPEVDGLGVLQFIRGEPSLRHLPVILLSNCSYFSGITQSALDVGATAFVHKGSYSPRALVDEVRKVTATPAAPPARTQAQVPPPLPAEAVSKAETRRGPARVLLADDDQVIHGVLTFFMNQAGIEIRSAFDGRRAIEIAQVDPPDVLVLDRMMPELDGLAVLEEWRSNPQLADIPVIMLTASETEESRAKAMNWGASEYLTKPFSPGVLVRLVQKHIQRPV